MTGQRAGFSLVEVIVALMILSVAILAMGASTGYVMAQVQASELRSERVTAVRQAAETLRGTAWSDLENVCSAASTHFGTDHYAVSCTVTLTGNDVKRVDLVTTGPGFQANRFVQSMADTFALSIANPVQ